MLSGLAATLPCFPQICSPTSLSRPNSTSVASVRSCASSRMMTLYFSSSGSLMASRRSIPSVQNLQDAGQFVVSGTWLVHGWLQGALCTSNHDHSCGAGAALGHLSYLMKVLGPEHSSKRME